MTDRHDAALRAALAERDRLRAQWQTHYTDNYVVARIVEVALAAADAHDTGKRPPPLSTEARSARLDRINQWWTEART